MPEDPKPPEGGKPPAPPNPNATAEEKLAAATKTIDGLTSDLKKVREELDEVKGEAIQRRKDNKTLREQLAGMAGLPAEGVNLAEKVAAAEAARDKQWEGKLKNLTLRAAVERAAAMAEAHDPADIVRLMDLDGLEVDVESGTVKDPKALTERLGKFKESKPHLFKAASEPPPAPGAPPKPGAKPPPRPTLGGNGTAYEQWKTLMDAGDLAGAKAFFDQPGNAAKIGAVIDTLPKRF